MSFVCSIPLIASLFSGCGGPAPLAVRYVEGEYVLLAPIEVASVETITVRRGDHVKSGEAIVTLENGDATIAVAQAEAALAQAVAQLADLQVGRRPEEIAVLEATLVSAQAQKEEAERVSTRHTDLLKRGIATQADFDQAKLVEGLEDQFSESSEEIDPKLADCFVEAFEQGSQREVEELLFKGPVDTLEELFETCSSRASA